MIDLFLQGGVLTMSILTFLLISVVIAFSKKQELVKSLGILAFIIGFFLLLFGAFTSLNIFYILGVSSIIISILTVCMGFLAVLLKQIMLKK